jgi:hypothetical protein
LIEGAVTDRSVEIVSARKMKKWMKQHPQKEGQVKATVKRVCGVVRALYYL